MSNQQVAHNIRYIRRTLGWSQNQLANELGVNRNNISSYEIRGVNLKPQLVKKLSELSRFSVEDILYNSLSAIDSGPRNESTRPVQNDANTLNEILLLKNELLAAKQAEIDALKLSLEALTKQTNEVRWASENSKGKFVDWNKIKIPTTNYVEIAPGVIDREMEHKDHFLFSYEDIFKPFVEHVDFSQRKVILNRSAPKSFFAKHYHVECESLICVKGSFTETVSGRTLQEGDRIDFESFQTHEIVCHLDTFILVLIDK